MTKVFLLINSNPNLFQICHDTVNVKILLTSKRNTGVSKLSYASLIMQKMIKDFEGFDPESDCKRLNRAMEGLGKKMILQIQNLYIKGF